MDPSAISGDGSWVGSGSTLLEDHDPPDASVMESGDPPGTWGGDSSTYLTVPSEAPSRHDLRRNQQSSRSLDVLTGVAPQQPRTNADLTMYGLPMEDDRHYGWPAPQTSRPRRRHHPQGRRDRPLLEQDSQSNSSAGRGLPSPGMATDEGSSVVPPRHGPHDPRFATEHTFRPEKRSDLNAGSQEGGEPSIGISEWRATHFEEGHWKEVDDSMRASMVASRDMKSRMLGPGRNSTTHTITNSHRRGKTPSGGGSGHKGRLLELPRPRR